MTDFDPNSFADMMDDYIEIADANIKQEYQRELNALKGLSENKINEFGGATSQMEDIIKEIEKAKESNITQAELINNITILGKSTYSLAKKVSALIP
jgi:hypothetical protein